MDGSFDQPLVGDIVGHGAAVGVGVHEILAGIEAILRGEFEAAGFLETAVLHYFEFVFIRAPVIIL